MGVCLNLASLFKTCHKNSRKLFVYDMPFMSNRHRKLKYMRSFWRYMNLRSLFKWSECFFMMTRKCLLTQLLSSECVGQRFKVWINLLFGIRWAGYQSIVNPFPLSVAHMQHFKKLIINKFYVNFILVAVFMYASYGKNF